MITMAYGIAKISVVRVRMMTSSMGSGETGRCLSIPRRSARRNWIHSSHLSSVACSFAFRSSYWSLPKMIVSGRNIIRGGVKKERERTTAVIS